MTNPTKDQGFSKCPQCEWLGLTDEHVKAHQAEVHSAAPSSKQCSIWHRANAVEVPDVPEMIDHPGDTVSCYLAISDGFRVGRARWHYPTKSWCHKGSYDGNVLFWSLVPNWDRTSDETAGVQVAGDTLPTALWQFEQRASVLLSDEQAKASPDNALIGFLCDAVRLARENERLARSPLEPDAVSAARIGARIPYDIGLRDDGSHGECGTNPPSEES